MSGAFRAEESRRIGGLAFPARVLACSLVLALSGCTSGDGDDWLGPIDDFQFTERSGRTVSRDHLAGKVWVAGFVFTRCAGPCTQISGSMAQLQQATQGQRDFLLVSFSVDPDHDTPAVLQKYADNFQADPERWLFLTGDREKMYTLIQDSFKLGVSPNEGAARTPGNEVMHSTRLVLVDRHGEKRGYFDGTDAEQMTRLRRRIAALLRENP
jgi:cytochrome oxidase Cu insertion factor (SCO1/SenC/PrrC family)